MVNYIGKMVKVKGKGKKDKIGKIVPGKYIKKLI